MSSRDVRMVIDRMVTAEDGSVESVVTVSLGYVAETPADALRLVALMTLQALDEEPP